MLRRLLAVFIALIAVFSIVGGTTSAFAQTTTSSQLTTTLPNGSIRLNYNTVETYGWCYDQFTNRNLWGTCTNGYDGIDQSTGGWTNNCYQPDCGQIGVTNRGVSVDHRKDLHFVTGYFAYGLNTADGLWFYINGTWNGKSILPFFRTVKFGGRSYRLQLTFVNAYYARDGLPFQVYQPCSTTTPCKGGGMK